MKKITSTILLLVAVAFNAMAQKPLYLPGDGIYIVGIPADLSKPYDGPVMVTESYQAKFETRNAEFASIKTDKSINISNRLLSDGTLDLVSFMGTGMAKNLTVRNYDGEAYSIGNYAPEKTWTDSYLVAGFAPWNGKDTYPLGVYNHWDCPVTYDEDTHLTDGSCDRIEVFFGNPHEGLVCKGVNFNIISPDDALSTKISNLEVGIKMMGSDFGEYKECEALASKNLQKVGTTDNGNNIYSVYLTFSHPVILNDSFGVEITGFTALGTEAWLPRAIDTHDLFPSHTAYIVNDTPVTVANSDVCVNIDAYFNYVGQWAWYDGKEEFGECVAQGDYVQVYYDPSDEDWPGEYFTGEPTFPVECTFGYQDLMIAEKPDWISDIQVDDSQWAEYEALLIIMTADALPSGETGRLGDVVVSTLDEASTYTIHIRQGNATFTGIADNVIEIPVDGGIFDLSGRRITSAQPGQIIITNGKKYINK